MYYCKCKLLKCSTHVQSYLYCGLRTMCLRSLNIYFNDTSRLKNIYVSIQWSPHNSILFQTKKVQIIFCRSIKQLSVRRYSIIWIIDVYCRFYRFTIQSWIFSFIVFGVWIQYLLEYFDSVSDTFRYRIWDTVSYTFLYNGLHPEAKLQLKLNILNSEITQRDVDGWR